jgi:trehalose 6-phosphate synthase
VRNTDNRCYIVGVDRLDYTKGLPERIRGVEAFLKNWPAYRGRVQFLQIAPPTREGLAAYDAVRGELERMTGHANGRFGDFSWTPIHYVHRPVSRALLAGLFRHCRVALVTPLRDGMNLVAKEYIAAQDVSDPGVLVLSQFAGAAEQLEEALIVNPHDPASLATAIQRAIEMPLGERIARHRALRSSVSEQHVGWWRERFLAALAKASKNQPQAASERSILLHEAAGYGQRTDSRAG